MSTRTVSISGVTALALAIGLFALPRRVARAEGDVDATLKAMSEASAQGDYARWFELLRRQTLILIGPLESTMEGHEPALRMLGKAGPGEDAAARVGSLVVVADVLSHASRPRWVLQDSIDSRLTRSGAESCARLAAVAWARVFAMRLELGETERKALSFTSPFAVAHPTARDVITYLYVSFLIRPGAAAPSLGPAEVKRLQGALPEGPEREGTSVGKACAVLDDLERWHLGRSKRSSQSGALAAALEARLARQILLFRAFPERAEREAIVAGLRFALPAYRGHPSWSRGMAQLALFVKETAGSRRAAIALVRVGQRAHPDSEEGRQCAVIAKALESKTEDTAVALYFSAGGPGGSLRGSALYHEPGSVRLRTSRVPLESLTDDVLVSWIQNEPWSSLLRAPGAGLRPQTHVLELTAPRGPTVSQVFADAPGAEERKGILNVEGSLDEGQERSMRPILVSDLTLAVEREDRSIRVRALRPKSGSPASGAVVRLFRQTTALTLMAATSTDAEGLASLPVPAPLPQPSRLILIARCGQDVAFAEVMPSQEDQSAKSRSESTAWGFPALPLTRVWLDRWRARPGEEVLWKADVRCGPGSPAGLTKAILADRPGARVPVAAGARLTLTLKNTRHQVLGVSRAVAGPHGTAAGAIVLPDTDAEAWTLDASVEAPCLVRARRLDRRVVITIPRDRQTAEPPLELTLGPLPAFLAPRTEVAGRVHRAGRPVGNTAIFWEVLAPVQEQGGYRGDLRPGPTVMRRLRSGESVTDTVGRFSVSFVAPEGASNAGWILAVRTRSTGGEIEEVERAFPVFASEVALSISGARVHRRGEPIELTLGRASAFDGTPRRGASHLVVQRVLSVPRLSVGEQVLPSAAEVTRTERLLDRSQGGPVVRRQRVEHDPDGRARCRFTLDPGFYRITIKSRDGQGRVAQTAFGVVVDGPGLRAPIPLAVLVDEAGPGPRRAFIKSAGDRAFVRISREGSFEERSISADSDGVVDLDGVTAAPSTSAVNIRAYTVFDGQLSTFQQELSGRTGRPRIEIVSMSPVLELRAFSEDGRPASDIEIEATAGPAAAWGVLESMESTEATGRRSLQVPEIRQGADSPQALVLEREGYEGHGPRLVFREPSRENGPVDAEIPRGWGSCLPERYPRFTFPDYRAPIRSASLPGQPVPGARLSAWLPVLVTDSAGRARGDFRIPPGIAHIVRISAVAADGSASSLTLPVFISSGLGGSQP